MNKAVLHILSILLTIPGTLISSLVVFKYWHWFAVGQLGLPVITYSGAIALAMLLGLITYGRNAMDALKDDAEVDDTIKLQLQMYLVAYPLALLIGWLWHLALS